MLYHYLHTRDDSISNHIQELEWNEQSSIEKLKDFLCSRMIEIMQQNFTMRELDLIAEMRGSPAFECVYQNFKFESNLNNFLESLKSEIAMLSSRKASPRSPIVLRSEHHQMMTKKSSDSQLLDNKYRDKKKGEGRKYSDEHEEDLRSPKSSCNPIHNVSLALEDRRQQLQQPVVHQTSVDPVIRGNAELRKLQRVAQGRIPAQCIQGEEPISLRLGAPVHPGRSQGHRQTRAQVKMHL